MQGLNLKGSHQAIARMNGAQGFWRRQFTGACTDAQKTFDGIFGIVVPHLCFIFDPVVFTVHHLLGPSFLLPYKLPVYFMSLISMVALALWLYRGEKLRALSGVLGGILLSGAACSLLIGALILPISLIGLIVLVGVLGFIPFVTAFVYLRNGLRALRSPNLNFPHAKAIGALMLGVLLTIDLPALAHWKANRIITQAMNDVLQGNSNATAAVGRLKYLGWAGDSDEIVWAYAREENQERKGKLAQAYQQIIGQNIEERLALLRLVD